MRFLALATGLPGVGKSRKYRRLAPCRSQILVGTSINSQPRSAAPRRHSSRRRQFLPIPSVRLYSGRPAGVSRRGMPNPPAIPHRGIARTAILQGFCEVMPSGIPPLSRRSSLAVPTCANRYPADRPWTFRVDPAKESVIGVRQRTVERLDTLPRCCGANARRAHCHRNRSEYAASSGAC